ncbi:MAG: Asp-tRNA(Asn)/Glu-tRNA(Gln) amidotransferase subunit GatB [Ekhidna sp.]
MQVEDFEIVVGLEVHIQLQTESKLFAADVNAFGKEPNTNVSVITLAHPGTLPVLNKKAVAYAIKMGLACRCDISKYNYFDRKHYFYPDLPKGFQTTQDHTPICKGGYLDVLDDQKQKKRVQINRIHLEEDAGKSIHQEGEPDSLIDLNRAGVPLIELVTEPVIHSSVEAMNFLNEIRKIVDYLEICDGNMEQGSLRCDANISVRKKGSHSLGSKVEVKNMNSVRNVGKAIASEAKRQIDLIQGGATVVSETRLFDVATGKTYGMRMKEVLNDYRYFPEPDLAPFEVDDQWLNQIKSEMPPMHWEKKEELMDQYGLPEYDASVLTESRALTHFFESTCAHTTYHKATANWLLGPIKSYLNEYGMEVNALPITPAQLGELVMMVAEEQLSFSLASKELLPYLMENGGSPEKVACDKGLLSAEEDNLDSVVMEVLRTFPEKVEAYHGGKKGLTGFFMGEVMKKTNGKAHPKQANDVVVRLLKELE